MTQPWQGRIGIIGAGALGGYYGARLARAGGDVHFLMRRDYDTVKTHGLVVHSIDGDFELHPPVYRRPAALGVCDLVIIGLKAFQNEALVELLEPTTGADTIVLTLQNGLGNEEAIVAALGKIARRREETPDQASLAERIVGGTAFLCSNRTAPGVISHTDHGWIRLAEYGGPATERTHALAAMFRDADVKCEVFDSLAQIRWEKLVWNIPFNGLGVAGGGADTAVVLADRDLKAAAVGLMEEVLAAARADGVEIDPDFIGRMIDATTTMGAYRSSMQVDWEAGRPLEVEALLGEPLRRARADGIATPRLELLYGLVKRHNPAG